MSANAKPLLNLPHQAHVSNISCTIVRQCVRILLQTEIITQGRSKQYCNGLARLPGALAENVDRKPHPLN